MRISDWSSDVCSSDLAYHGPAGRGDFDLVRRDHDRSGAGCGDLGVSSLRPLRTAVDLTMGARILAKNLSLDVPAFLQRERPSSGWGGLFFGAAFDPPKRRLLRLLDTINFELREGDRLAILGRKDRKSTRLNSSH